MTADGHPATAPIDPRGRREHTSSNGPAPAAPLTTAAWCTVRVRGPQGSVDVALPTAATVAETVEELSSRLLPGAPVGRPGETWYLHRLGGPPFHPATRLGDSGLHDGESLHLSPHPMPRPAQPVDDGVVALAEGAARAGRWSPRTVQALALVGTVVASVGASVLGLAVPGGPVVPLVLAVVLVGLALALRSPGDGDLPALAAGLAALPAWASAGFGFAVAAGGGPAVAVASSAGGVAVGSALAAAFLPRRAPWWAFFGAGGVTLAVAAAVVAADLLGPAQTAALVATLWLVGLVATPWLVTRNRNWLAPDALSEEALVARAAAARRTVDAVALAGSAAVAVAGLVVAGTGQGLAVAFVGAASAVIVLRSRRSVFVVESSAELAAGAVGLAAVVGALVAGGGTGLRVGLLAAVLVLLGLLVGLGLAARQAAAGSETALAWWARPRTRRTLDVLEATAAVAVLPLLAGVLGLYAAAADAGARI